MFVLGIHHCSKRILGIARRTERHRRCFDVGGSMSTLSKRVPSLRGSRSERKRVAGDRLFLLDRGSSKLATAVFCDCDCSTIEYKGLASKEQLAYILNISPASAKGLTAWFSNSAWACFVLAKSSSRRTGTIFSRACCSKASCIPAGISFSRTVRLLLSFISASLMSARIPLARLTWQPFCC